MLLLWFILTCFWTGSPIFLASTTIWTGNNCCSSIAHISESMNCFKIFLIVICQHKNNHRGMTIYFFVRNVAYQNKSLGFALYIVGIKYILYNCSCFTFLPGLHPSIDRLEAVRRNKFFPHIVFIVVLITVIKKQARSRGSNPWFWVC